MNEQPKYIAHYGVKGQRWGVRRNLRKWSNTRAKARMAAQKQKQADRKIKYDAKNQAKRDRYMAKHLSGLSDRQLQQFTNRQNALANARSAYGRANGLQNQNNNGGKNKNNKGKKQGYSFSDALKKTAGNIAIKQGSKYVNSILNNKYKNWELNRASKQISNGKYNLEQLLKVAESLGNQSGGKKMKHSSNLEDSIAHYGTLGMRWGVRRSRNRGSGSWQSRHTKNTGKQTKRLAKRMRKKDPYSLNTELIKRAGGEA
ncbi:MAG: hypothetical protein HUJ63_03755 [Enterococcus sp.]|nr:hypothetical protein [Enterococcus sp.]